MSILGSQVQWLQTVVPRRDGGCRLVGLDTLMQAKYRGANYHQARDESAKGSKHFPLGKAIPVNTKRLRIAHRKTADHCPHAYDVARQCSTVQSGQRF